MEVVKGPVVETETSGTIIYQITLASGVIVTDPSAFGRQEARPAAQDIPVFADDGRPLVVSSYGFVLRG